MIHVREGDTVITNGSEAPNEWQAHLAVLAKMVEAVGQTQAGVMLRAKNSAISIVMSSGERERLAAGRLVARGLLVRNFPGAGPGHPLRRYYKLTDRGQTVWLLVRGEK